MWRVPATAAPRWRTWQLAVPTFGFASVDQRQPGSIRIRPIAVSSRLTTSKRPWPSCRTSSAFAKFRFCRRGTPVFCGSLPECLAQAIGERLHLGKRGLIALVLGLRPEPEDLRSAELIRQIRWPWHDVEV